MALSARLLKFSSGIAPVLAVIYNESTVPDDWRQANVAPVVFFQKVKSIMLHM